MRSVKLSLIIFICFLVTFSVIVSKLILFINTLDDNVPPNHSKNETNRFEIIGNSTENLIWMIQISDLHISVFHDLTRISELSEFCSRTLDIIKPAVVLATGDLTDSNTSEYEYTELEEEWIIYREILNSNNVTNKTLWLDIRGNHDNFNVLDINSQNNYFRKYSVQGPNHPRSYLYIKEMNNNQKLGLLGVDLCLTLGVKERFNFLGQLEREEISTVRKYVQDSKKEGVNYLLWFGHYPTSVIRYPDSQELRELIGNDERTIAYLSGHLHELCGNSHLYTYQKEGYFELELGDWRKHRVLRIMAIDHGQFSFTDVKHGTWPIILVTNPRSASLVPPGLEANISSSSHIRSFVTGLEPCLYLLNRILVFSSFPLTAVELQIDSDDRISCTSVGGPLYVAEWNEKEYSTGLHVITVTARSAVMSKQIQHKFSLDGSRIQMKLFSRFVLMPNLGLMYYFLFVSTTMITILSLIMYRCLVKYSGVAAESIMLVKWRCLRRWIRRMCSLVDINRFFYPLMIYSVYIFIGPWALIHVTENTMGLVFAGGFLVNGTFQRSWMVYPIGWLQINTHVFLIFHLARQIDRKCHFVLHKGDLPMDHLTKKFRPFLKDNIFFILVLLFQLYDIYIFWLSYNYFATFLLCPMKTAWIMMALWLKQEAYFLEVENLP